MPKEIWKTVLRSEENMRDAMMYFVDDYIKLKEFYEESQIDDATWMTVDEARDEREELEAKIKELEEELYRRNKEYVDLADRYNKLVDSTRPKKKVLKKAKTYVEDEIPF